MLTLKERNGRFWYPLIWHPVSRVLKFECFCEMFQRLTPGTTVLDFGSGDRPFEPLLLSKFDNYIAADHPDANLGHSRKPDLFIIGDRLAIESETVDCVVLTEVLEHIYQPHTALGEIYRLLKPGDTLIGTVPFAMKEHEQPYDFHRYTYFCLDRMFCESAFIVHKIEYVGDMVGVAILTTTRVVLVVRKVMRNFRLGPIASFVEVFIRLPEFVYYALRKTRLNPQRLAYFREFPFGFVFHVEKPSHSQISDEPES